MTTRPPSLPSSDPSPALLLPSPPFVHIEGVPNFRDLGGYPCSPIPPSVSSEAEPHPHHENSSTTCSVRTGLLYRCAQLTNISTEGIIKLTSQPPFGLAIHSLYDLRSAQEIAKLAAKSGGPAFEIPDITRNFVPVFTDEDNSPVALAAKFKMYSAPDNPADGGYSKGFVDAYRDILQHAGPAYKRILSHICHRPSEPLIFHCTAGKDRTGVLAALILKLCGVSDEIIAWEYSLTERGLGKWRDFVIRLMMAPGGLRLDGTSEDKKDGGGVGGVEGRGFSSATREEAERILSSRSANMRAFLMQVIDGEYGGVEKCLSKLYGLIDDDLRMIRKNLIMENRKPVVPVEELMLNDQ